MKAIIEIKELEFENWESVNFENLNKGFYKIHYRESEETLLYIIYNNEGNFAAINMYDVQQHLTPISDNHKPIMSLSEISEAELEQPAVVSEYFALELVKILTGKK